MFCLSVSGSGRHGPGEAAESHHEGQDALRQQEVEHDPLQGNNNDSYESENVDDTNDVLLVHGEVQQEAGAHCGHATEPGHQDQC